MFGQLLQNTKCLTPQKFNHYPPPCEIFNLNPRLSHTQKNQLGQPDFKIFGLSRYSKNFLSEIFPFCFKKTEGMLDRDIVLRE